MPTKLLNGDTAMNTVARSLAIALAGVLFVGAATSFRGSLRGAVSNNTSTLSKEAATKESPETIRQDQKEFCDARAELLELRATIDQQQQQIDALVGEVTGGRHDISRLRKANHTSEVIERALRSVASISITERRESFGGGVVIDARGYILTCSHVVNDERPIAVTLADGRKREARRIAHDEKNDLAILSVMLGTLIPAEFGESRDLAAGEPVLAVGSPYGYKRTVTRGIVSALKRTVEVTDQLVFRDLIQTDPSINPGNSSGPLFNVDGKVVGIVVAVPAGASGIAFAIPSERANSAAFDMLRKKDEGDERKRTEAWPLLGR